MRKVWLKGLISLMHMILLKSSEPSCNNRATIQPSRSKSKSLNPSHNKSNRMNSNPSINKKKTSLQQGTHIRSGFDSRRKNISAGSARLRKDASRRRSS